MKKIILKPMIFIIALIVFISLAACTLPSSSGTIPATPTMPLAIPVITAAPTEGVEEAEVVDEEVDEIVEEVVVPIEVEEEIEEPTELPEEEPAQDIEETEVIEEEIEPTSTPVVVEIAEEEEDESEDEIVSATPTAIPYVYTANPDPMVMFYGATNCYVAADTDSVVSVVVPRGIALGAYRRNWNFYQVVHPTKPGRVCWVTGDTIRPNQSAYNLKP